MTVEQADMAHRLTDDLQQLKHCDKLEMKELKWLKNQFLNLGGGDKLEFNWYL